MAVIAAMLLVVAAAAGGCSSSTSPHTSCTAEHSAEVIERKIVHHEAALRYLRQVKEASVRLQKAKVKAAMSGGAAPAAVRTVAGLAFPAGSKSAAQERWGKTSDKYLIPRGWFGLAAGAGNRTTALELVPFSHDRNKFYYALGRYRTLKDPCC